MHRDRTSEHGLVVAAVGVGPGLVDADGLVEGGFGQFPGQAPDRFDTDPAALADCGRRIVIGKKAFGQQLERRHCRAAVGQGVLADHHRRDPDLTRPNDFMFLTVVRARAGTRCLFRGA